MKNEIIKTLPFGTDVRIVTTDVQLTPELAEAVRQSWDLEEFSDRHSHDVQRTKMHEKGHPDAEPWWDCRVRDLQVNREKLGFRPAPQMSSEAMDDHGQWSLIAPAGMIPVLAVFFRSRYACPTLVLTTQSPIMGLERQITWGEITHVLDRDPREFFIHLFVFDDLVRLHSSTGPIMNGQEQSLLETINANIAAIVSTVQLPANNGSGLKPCLRVVGNVISENFHKADLDIRDILGELVELNRENNTLLKKLAEPE